MRRSSRGNTIAAAVLAIAAIALVPGCGGEEGNSQTTVTPAGFAAVAGDWSGMLSQAATEPFPIDVSVESEDDPERNVVRYGGEIACSGTWGYLGDEGAEILFREVIDRGRGGRCKGVGTVRLSPTADADRLDYEFRGGGVESEGVLSRAG